MQHAKNTPCHFSFGPGPRPAWGRGPGGRVQKWRPGSRGLSRERQLPGPQAWALPSAQPSRSSASPVVSGPGPSGASRGTLWSSSRRAWASGGLVFPPPPSGSAHLVSLQDARALFLLGIRPLPPSLATACRTNSSNTPRTEFPHPEICSFLPLCLRSCCFFRLECLSLLLLPHLPGKHPFILHSPPQRPPPPGRQPRAPPVPPPAPGYLCSL